jgi:protein arginine N-methyltransferase 1
LIWYSSLQVTDLLQFHQWLLSDRARTRAYQDAIARTVKKDNVVLDVGAGTGLLSFFACVAGARKVYAVEETDIAELGLQICSANGFGDRVKFVKDRSQNVSLPEPVDIIVSDTGASFGLQDGMLGTLIDARTRLLKPGGQIVPQSLELHVAPVELENARSLDIWNKNRYGLDLSAIRQFAANTNYHVLLDRESVLAVPQLLNTIDFHTATNSYVSGEVVSVVARSGTMHGVAGWISVSLAPGVLFDNSPVNPSDRTAGWTQSVFPIETPVLVRAGDRVRTKISTHNGKAWRWQIEIIDGDERSSNSACVKASFDHSTLGSFPIRPEQLKKKLPDYAPRLSRKGAAESYVLAAFDGKHAMKELTEELLVRFADCFPTKTAAAEFIGRIVDRCT